MYGSEQTQPHYCHLPLDQQEKLAKLIHEGDIFNAQED